MNPTVGELHDQLERLDWEALPRVAGVQRGTLTVRFGARAVTVTAYRLANGDYRLQAAEGDENGRDDHSAEE